MWTIFYQGVARSFPVDQYTIDMCTEIRNVNTVSN